MAMLFIFNRVTGEPLFPIDERPVPQGAPKDAWGLTFWDRNACRDQFEALRFEGIYTPPTEQGTLMCPGNVGGSNWGSVAVDASRSILIANVQDFPWAVTLILRDAFPGIRGASEAGIEFARQHGTPYGMRREPILSPLGVRCNRPTWGSLVAVDLRKGDIL